MKGSTNTMAGVPLVMERSTVRPCVAAPFSFCVGSVAAGLARLISAGMSRAFVKESDDDLELPDRPVSEHPNDVTAEGFAQIEVSLAASRQAVAIAQSAGDRSAVAQASRDLRYWTARRATAQIVAASGDRDPIRFGATVTIRRDDGREQTFRIVGEDEANPGQGTISHVSPLARAMFGRSLGDLIRIGPSEAEILRIV